MIASGEPAAARKDLLAREALAQIPKILTLQDRNRHSPTYGCFDRNYWQYRIIDFPSGMAQEFVLPLALAYRTEIAGTPFLGQAALRDWVLAGFVTLPNQVIPTVPATIISPMSGPGARRPFRCWPASRPTGFSGSTTRRAGPFSPGAPTGWPDITRAAGFPTTRRLLRCPSTWPARCWPATAGKRGAGTARPGAVVADRGGLVLGIRGLRPPAT